MTTIITATFANDENTAVVIETEECGAVVISENDRPDLWAEYLAWEGVTAPAATIDQDLVDMDALNRALTAEGTFTRAVGEVLFGVVKGTIPVTPSLTKAQFVTLLKSKMR